MTITFRAYEFTYSNITDSTFPFYSNDPLLEQFGRYVWDLLHLDFGDSVRRARPAFEVVSEAFLWTLQLAVITMTLVTGAAIVVGLGAAYAF